MTLKVILGHELVELFNKLMENVGLVDKTWRHLASYGNADPKETIFSTIAANLAI